MNSFLDLREVVMMSVLNVKWVIHYDITENLSGAL